MSSFRFCLALRIDFLKERKFKLGLLALPQSRIGLSQPIMGRCQLRIRLDGAREKSDAPVELSFPLGNDPELQIRFRKAGIEMNSFSQAGFGRLVIGVRIGLGAQIQNDSVVIVRPRVVRPLLHVSLELVADGVPQCICLFVNLAQKEVCQPIVGIKRCGLKNALCGLLIFSRHIMRAAQPDAHLS